MADLRKHLQLVLSLADHLETLPAEIVNQEYRYESFGSWSLVVRRSGKHFRVDFDGRQRVLLVYMVLPTGERNTRAPELLAEESLPMGLTSESLAGVRDAIERATAHGAGKYFEKLIKYSSRDESRYVCEAPSPERPPSPWEDTWTSFDRLAPVLDKRFAEWKRARS
jgi:hypothetical protein